MNDDPDPAVTKRLAWIPDPVERARYAARYEAGESIAHLARETGLSTIRLTYCLRQHIVEANPKLWLAATREAVRDAEGGPYSDKAWLTCRIRRSGYRLEQLQA